MKTSITFPFLLATVSNAFFAQIVAGAGITGITISEISESGNILKITANRHLTDAEKASVKAVFMASVMTITDDPS